jgi:hypothetical protein
MRSVLTWALPASVLLASLVMGAVAYERFLPKSRQLFGIGEHDRNAHYWLGLSMGQDVRHGHLGHLLYDVHKARTWPPLHPLLLSVVLAVGGPDFRLAVLPSLAGWIGTAFFGFLLARRAVPRGGNLAGLVAALFILSSPALKAYATDIMLESLGACLSLLVLYLYVRAVQEPSTRAGRLLALGLTALFFHKYNYWLLVVGALGAAQLSSEPRRYWNFLTAILASWRPWLARAVRQPLNYLLALAVALLALVAITGPLEFTLGGRPMTIAASGLLLELPYYLLFVRVALWWWQAGRTWCAALADPVRPLVYWHAWPVALWLLWPQKLSYFLWYSFAPHGAKPGNDLVHGLRFYCSCWLTDYHIATVSAAVALGFVALALLGRRWLRPGGQVVLWLVALALLLTARHPNQNSRFLNSWVAGTWVTAGVGLAWLIHGRFSGRWQSARPWLAAATAAGIGIMQFPGLLAPGRAPEGAPMAKGGTALDVTDWYLPYLANSRQAMVVATVPMKFLCLWSGIQRYGPEQRIEFADACGAQARHSLEQWLATTRADTLIYVDVPPGSRFAAADEGYGSYDQLRDLLPAQARFLQVAQHHFSEYGCSVSVWRQAAAAQAGLPSSAGISSSINSGSGGTSRPR